MSALRATEQAKIVMESDSVIEDTLNDLTRNKGTDTKSVGPAGAIWIQGGTLEMQSGSKIQNVNGRAVYADGGTVTIGGTISGITANKNAMWQADNGTAIHLRNGATGTLTATASITGISGGGSAVCCTDEATSSTLSFKMENGSKITNCPELKGNAIYAKNSTITIDGEISNVYATGNHILQTDGGTTVTIGENGAILNNHAHYGAIYINGNEEKLDIYGKINGNICTDRGGGVVLSNNGGTKNATMYPGAEICNNVCAQTGGGVMVSRGTFTMNGGTISGNISGTNTTKDDEKVGGGVFVRRGGQFIMNDGVIENNTATGIGGGVCFDASDNGGFVPKVELNGGTVKNNLMNATVDAAYQVTGGSSNDLAISSTNYGKADRYLSISDEVSIGNKAVYFQTNTKTVTPDDDSLDIKLGNASNDTKNNVNVVGSLTTASTDKGWGNPLATFWAQRDGAATLSVGGLTSLNSDLPVYVLALPVDENGAAATSATARTAQDAQVYKAEKSGDSAVNFTLPDIYGNGNGNGYAIAVVQPTQDYGTLSISGPATLQENKTGSDYSVTYTVKYAVSDNMANIIKTAGGNASYNLAINKDTNLTGTVGTFNGKEIEVTYTLSKDDFEAGKSLFASAVLTITVDQNSSYTIPSNVAETKMVGLHNVLFVWNDGTNKTDTVSVADGQAIGTQMSADPTRSGYTFTGWNIAPDGTGTAVTKDTVINSRLTAYAQWKKNSSGGGSTTYYYFSLEKVDAQDSHTLSGAKFGLYLDGTQIATATSNSSGIATFRVDTSSYRKITTTSSLYYQELTAPEGYVLSSDRIDLEKSDLTTSQTTAEKNAETVRNYQKSAPDGLNGKDHVAYVRGYTDGTVKPNSNVTRAETATMLYRLLTESRRNEIQTTNNSFSDVLADAWYNEAVSTMANGKYITGYPNGTFGGGKSITRAEFVTMLVRFIGVQNEDCSFTDVSKSDWAYRYIATATKAGWIAGYTDGTFKPEQPITRAEAMTIINRVLDRGVNEQSELLSFKVWPDNASSAWYYYEVIEASNEHEYTGSRPSENWTSLSIH
jgi:uncharacterized repeat protein (TIGR02543 family)